VRVSLEHATGARTQDCETARQASSPPYAGFLRRSIPRMPMRTAARYPRRSGRPAMNSVWCLSARYLDAKEELAVGRYG
jgi:hypothetical protein